MKIVTFEDVEDIFANGHEMCYFQSGCSGKAQIAILGIDSIFEYEENKPVLLEDKYASIAIIDDESDYDAFKNFGIDTWIKRDDLIDLNDLLHQIDTRILSA